MPRRTGWIAIVLIAAALAPAAPLWAADDPPAWAAPMRRVHAKFTGTPGTLALFGDSITVSLAFWAPLPYAPKDPPKELAEALELIKPYMREECWRQWRGPQFGNNGRMTVRWAHDNIDDWLKKLNPEAAVIMFGTNDVADMQRDEYESKLRDVVKRCLANGTVVMLTTLPPRGDRTEKAAQFAQSVRKVAGELDVPLIDYHAQVLQRRPDDWDGRLPKFKGQGEGVYDVPTLIARDGIHPSNPGDYQDYSAKSLNHNGFALRNYLTALTYADVIRHVLKPGQS